MELYSIVLVIQGYHIYKEPASIRAVLHCERESFNLIVSYAVAIIYNRVVFGHLPQAI